MTEKPLFIPLKAEYFRAFADGTKHTEYRIYGPRWNERTCRVGRAVTLSLGYGTRERLSGRVSHFVSDPMNCLDAHTYRELMALYPLAPPWRHVACISIELSR